MDFKLFYRLNQMLVKFDFSHLDFNEPVAKYDITITTHSEASKFKHPNKVILSSNYSDTKIMTLIIEAQKKLTNRDLIIGVDPGKNIGVAMLYSDEILTTNIFTDYELMVKWIRNQIVAISYSSLIIKVGNGSNEYLSKILERIVNEFDEIAAIELVNERNTSIKSNKKLSIHEQAAILIAKRS